MRRLFGPRDIFIMPARHGWIFLVALAALLFGAANYANNLAFLLTFLLFSMAVASLVHTHRNLRGVEMRFMSARPAFAGREMLFELLLSAPPPLRASLELSLPRGPVTNIDLEPGQKQRVVLRAPTSRRGWLEPGPVQLASSHPLGLFRGWTRKRLDLRGLVYPRPLDADLPLATGAVGNGEGEAPCPGVDDFTGLRAYQPGDPLQRIAWKASSRGHGLHTKEFEGQCGEALVLDFDTVGQGDTEWRLSALTRLVLDADSRHLEYGLRLPGRELEPGGGEEHKARCLETLALY